MVLATALAIAFLLVKVVEWSHLVSIGYTLNTGLQAQLYYTLTGVHGLHVLFGALATVYIVAKALRGGYTRESHKGVVEIGLYWGMVEMVWVFLFPMFYLL
jgi:heme/copper-type cytochrome/quinol oxidase subunit 3